MATTGSICIIDAAKVKAGSGRVSTRPCRGFDFYYSLQIEAAAHLNRFNSKSMRNFHLINIFLILSLFLSVGLACKPSTNSKRDPASTSSKAKTEKNYKLDEYAIKGFRFVYFRIPPSLERAALIETAQKLHDSEPDAQLLLVDDDTHLKDYIAYAKAASGQGEIEKTQLPKEWADKHIIANVQKYISGKFVLCEGNGYKEIAELE